MNGTSTIHSLNILMAELQEEHASLQGQLAELEKDIESLHRIIKRYKQKHGVPSSSTAKIDLSAVEGDSLYQRRKEALKLLAQANNGILIVREASEPMMKAGLFDSIKKFRAQVYATLADMGCWEKMTPGEYKLTDPSAIRLRFTEELKRAIAVPTASDSSDYSDSI